MKQQIKFLTVTIGLVALFTLLQNFIAVGSYWFDTSARCVMCDIDQDIPYFIIVPIVAMIPIVLIGNRWRKIQLIFLSLTLTIWWSYINYYVWDDRHAGWTTYTKAEKWEVNVGHTMIFVLPAVALFAYMFIRLQNQYFPTLSPR